MIYLDTNILVSLRIGDGNTGSAEEWYARQSVPLAFSTWGLAEFYGHLGLRTRKEEVTTRDAAKIVDQFDEVIAANLTLLKSSDAAILRAAAWLRSPNCALQAADALHLAIALENEAAAIATFDVRFAKGIEKLRIAGLKVIALPATGDDLHQARQARAKYNVTERDITKAVASARKRKTAERKSAPRLTVRG